MFVTSPALAALPGIRHAFFTREGGVSEGLYASLNAGLGSNDDGARVRENRRRMAETLGVAENALISCFQIHSPQVIVAETPHDGGDRPRADAVVTKVPGIACGVAAADCGPVLFADPQAGVVGAAHAGWKGAVGGVLEATVAAMEGLGADRARIHAAIGPLIRQPSYEVSQAFVDQFRVADESYERFFAAGRPGHAQFDLPGFIAHRLQAAGIAAIDDLGLDTYADETRFYSYRRTTHRKEPDYGRHIAGIALSG
ncbi:peptidoglycan editing factor PgeF [Phreatobacter cathodiphilus]|uniref:Purine nucleoside phosphorylase n=1 Tax=Phreatobacter cathodiphilus TaxID=1868589 RepID=A0A2S0NA24_9HYPH|nr:peptidoglycan editing factor PgeF [Phreatobacter cathodiphilus]AVO44781.1 peptidoglycan editing factor PgeF [Phreatobacter cathodiphilus]